MSFGEHLDELRAALFKSLLALLAGVLLGFLCARQVVLFVQSPLNAGLERFRTQQLREGYERELQRRRDAGDEVPDSARQTMEDHARRGFVPRRVLIDPDEARAAGLTLEAAAAPDAGGLVPLTLYEPIADDARANPMETNVQGPFLIWLKAALLAGAVFASPLIFYFLWEFVASGLYQHERKYVYIFMPFSIGLFLLGAGVAFFFVFRFVLEFLFGFFAWLDIDPLPRLSDWLNFALLLPLCFGAGFQLPLVMLFLERIGVASTEFYARYWKWAVMIIFILAMVISPGGDPYSMMFLAGPLTLLYFGGLGLCRFLPRRPDAPAPAA